MTPRLIRPEFEDGQDLAGIFDYLDTGAGLRGWLAHRRVSTPLRLDAWCAGRRLASTVAVLDRPDMDTSLQRRSWCGYLMGWSRFDRTALAQIAADTPGAEIELLTAGGRLKLPALGNILTAAEALTLIDAAPMGDRRDEFADLNAWHEIEASGLFDPFWYFRHYGPDTEANRPALLHYIQTGEAAGRRPNLYFDPVAYAAQHGLSADQPRLLHAIHRPETRVSPHFDPEWYRATYAPRTRWALAHYLSHRPGTLPNPLVTTAMLTSDSGTADPYEDFLRHPPATLQDGAAILADARQLFPTDAATLRGHIDSLVASGDLAAAEQSATAFRAQVPDPDGWERITLARLARAEGDRRTALTLLHGVKGEPLARAIAATLLIEMQDYPGAAEMLARLDGPPFKEAEAARIRLAASSGDHAGLAAALSRADLARIEPGVLCEAAYKLVRPGVPPEAGQQQAEDLVLRALALGSARNPHALQARIHMLLQRRRLADLEALLTEAETQPVAALVNLNTKWLELYALTGRLTEAVALCRDRMAAAVLDRAEGIIVLRLLSEAKAWDEAGGVILTHLAQGFGFGETVFHAMRVVRKAGLQGAILAAAAPAKPDADHGAFIDLVRMDDALIRAAQGGAAPDNLAWLTAAPAPETPEVVFLCADRAYFLSALTALASVFGQTAQSAAAVFVFLDKDVPPHWPAALDTVAQRFGRKVHLVHEADFVPQGVTLKAELGFFAAGAGLSRAAYFRLYAARHLQTLGRFARGLYLDTDIICRGDLRPLMAMDLGGASLAARPEDPGPEVQKAAEMNGLDPARYFNSGVLVMDFTHPGLTQGLTRAIALAETEPDRLIFHDQCALNIAFQAAELAPQWNHFLRPFRPLNAPVQDAILLHYLDRPKPWDITFWRNFREEWRIWALFVAQLLPQASFTEMLAAANEV